MLAATLLRSVGKGHDNELFVLLVDLIELSDRLEPLLRAVRVALARHHQVIVVCPWPLALIMPRKTTASLHFALNRFQRGTVIVSVEILSVAGRLRRGTGWLLGRSSGRFCPGCPPGS